MCVTNEHHLLNVGSVHNEYRICVCILVSNGCSMGAAICVIHQQILRVVITNYQMIRVCEKQCFGYVLETSYRVIAAVGSIALFVVWLADVLLKKTWILIITGFVADVVANLLILPSIFFLWHIQGDTPPSHTFPSVVTSFMPLPLP